LHLLPQSNHRVTREERVKFTIETEQEEDGRWLAEVLELPGALAYGATREEAVAHVQALGLRVLADRIEHGEAVPELVNTVFAIA
jgi:predicted RNase H-like HicB family nuclease